MIDQLLEPYIRRVHTRRGTRLTRGMVSTLRSYPNIPEIIRRTTHFLLHYQCLAGDVGVRTVIKPQRLYGYLIDTQDDWVKDVPATVLVVTSIPEPHGGGEVPVPDHHIHFESSIVFKRVAIHDKLCRQALTGALTIGRHVGLFTGHGFVELTHEFRRKLASGCSA